MIAHTNYFPISTLQSELVTLLVQYKGSRRLPGRGGTGGMLMEEGQIPKLLLPSPSYQLFNTSFWFLHGAYAKQLIHAILFNSHHDFVEYVFWSHLTAEENEG